MTDPRAAAEEPASNSPADLMGSPPARPARRAARPPTDLEFLQALPGGAFEGVALIDDQTFGPWVATLRRKDGRAKWFYGPDRETALRRARAWADRQGAP